MNQLKLNNEIIYHVYFKIRLYIYLCTSCIFFKICLNIILHGPLTNSKWKNNNCYTGYGN